ncbi:MAG: helix-turn-helix domain-containing protein [Phycisphaerae bacterium]
MVESIRRLAAKIAARAQHKIAYRKMCRMLREMREEASLTQRELAEKVKMHPSMVHRSEIGDRRIDPVEFANWCRACDRDPGAQIRLL